MEWKIENYQNHYETTLSIKMTKLELKNLIKKNEHNRWTEQKSLAC